MNNKNNVWKIVAIFFLGLIIGFTFNKLMSPFTVNSKNFDYCKELDKCQGNANAKVTMVEYTDYQCPFCKQFFNDTYLRLKKDFVDTNKIYYVSKDYPLPSHPQAVKSAISANCAAEQNKFWEMHDLLFQHQEEWSLQENHIETFKKLAADLKLDQSKFDQCLDSDKYKTLVENEHQEGLSEGVSGTPTFFINGKKVVGAQEYEVLAQEINNALNAK